MWSSHSSALHAGASVPPSCSFAATPTPPSGPARADGRWRDGVLRDYGGERTRPAYWKEERWNNPAQPVVGVTWYEAAAYCRWLSAATGGRYHLPSEAQWEKAAAYDPQTGATRRYPWGDEWREGPTNSKEANLEQTSIVGLFPGGRSALGVHGLAGNVWEWCTDWYDADYYAPCPLFLVSRSFVGGRTGSPGAGGVAVSANKALCRRIRTASPA